MTGSLTRSLAHSLTGSLTHSFYLVPWLGGLRTRTSWRVFAARNMPRAPPRSEGEWDKAQLYVVEAQEQATWEAIFRATIKLGSPGVLGRDTGDRLHARVLAKFIERVTRLLFPGKVPPSAHHAHAVCAPCAPYAVCMCRVQRAPGRGHLPGI